MRYREMRSEHAERGEMSGLGYTVDPNARQRLDLRLGDMTVESHPELTREIGAAADKPVRAVMRDRRRHRRPHPVTVEGQYKRPSLIPRS
jgi:hypothetical protein